MSTIYLVRHGVTSANRENRFAGRTGEKLLAEGMDQIRLVGERLRQRDIGAVYCGPSKRTRQSAEILGAQLDSPVVVLAGLDEILIPHWDGLTKDEISRQYGDQYPAWLSAPQTFRLPGCETLEQVQNRAAHVAERLLRGKKAQNFLLVSHLIVLRCLVLYFRGMPISEFRTIKIDNGSILQVSEGKAGEMSVRYL